MPEYQWMIQVRKPQDTTSAEGVKPQKLAIGVEGGFLTENEMFDVVKSHKLTVVDSDGAVAAEIPLPELRLPEAVQICIRALIVRHYLIQQPFPFWFLEKIPQYVRDSFCDN